ncbi:MAG: rhomboid family intramembrane serine protease [Gemmatimonadales bacterium]
MRRQSPLTLTPWVRGIIVANAVVYLLTITVFTGNWVIDWTAFSPTHMGGKIWTFVTYMFVHGGFFHLLFNMLMLFFFGPAVEAKMGGSAFGVYYFTCGVGGALLSFAIALFTPVAPFVGASAAVLGVALAFAMNWPDAPVFVFPLPVPIKVKWLVTFLAVVDLLMAQSSANDGVAHLAHLGGLLFGFLYLRGERLLSHGAEGSSRVVRSARQQPAMRSVHRLPQSGHAREGSQERDMHRDKRDDVDRVLDKISESGIDSLTSQELQLLDEASRQLRQH